MNPTVMHHNEWISLLDISGPFLSLPVLLEVFPNGLDEIESNTVSNLKRAYEEYLDSKNDVAIHSAWIDYVLENLLGFSADLLKRGQAIPSSISTFVPYQGVSIRPSIVLMDPTSEQPRLLIHKYHHTQALDRPPYGEASLSCLTRMMELLHATQVPLGLITNGEEWVLTYAPVGETSSYISFFSHLWFSERLTLRAFFSLLKLARFFGVQDTDTLPALFKRSVENQHGVTDLLGSQVRSSVQILVQAFDKADQDANRRLLKDLSPDSLYEAAITVMMRLVFLLYAEERELLPINENIYNQHYAISTLSDQLRTEGDMVGEEVLERHYDAWSRILSTSRLVFSGIRHDRLNLPAYGGSLFDPDRFAFLEGRPQGSDWVSELAKPLLIDNRTVLHILESIQYLYIKEYRQRQRLSFRALDIEQIGHIYEGLLEYKAARADEVMLGLEGAKDFPLPFISLAELEQLAKRGEEALSKQVNSFTGKPVSSIIKSLKKQVDIELSNRLQHACNHHEELYQRILPFASLLRVDEYETLVVIQSGSVYVTRGNTRRATGTHYTPRSLTEPIVQHTLEPVIYDGPAEGLPEAQWTLRHPSHLLNLKICDMAMGSGSFLVQVIRYLSERLIEAWEKLAPVTDPSKAAQVYLSPEGKVLNGPTAEALPNDLDARYLLARRLIADRCIYGVDKNHLAVEMAKLSIWLITLDKDRPFTFLDHALKCGDSLVGVDEQDFLNWTKSLINESAWSLFDETLRQELTQARAKRRELETFQVRDMTDVAMKEDLLEQANAAGQRIKLGCDLLVGAKLQGFKRNDQQAEESHLLLQWMAGETQSNLRCHTALKASNEVKAFHWFLEFPEVFEKGGFNAFVGNPPFMGGQKISGEFGDSYRNFLNSSWSHSSGSSDLSSYFFLQAFNNLVNNGVFGLIATNTISEGATRERGLEFIINSEGIIYIAHNNYKWPGVASVSVNIVYIFKGIFNGFRYLNGIKVTYISSFLNTIRIDRKPQKLISNSNKSFQGSIVRGLGFLLDKQEAENFIIKNVKNKDVLFPFINGEDLNSHPAQLPSRWCIQFDDMDQVTARSYSDIWAIAEERIKPFRKQKDSTKYPKLVNEWWKHWSSAKELYSAISNNDRVLVCSEVTKYLIFHFVPNGYIYAANLDVFSDESFAHFSIIQSTIHELWARNFCSHLETRLKYSPGNAYETFPFPLNNGILENIGFDYYTHRLNLMKQLSCGLTSVYNIFHDPEQSDSQVKKLRQLHMNIDIELFSCYGWSDIDLSHKFYDTPLGIRFTINEDAKIQVLTRLIDLNLQRYEEEVRAGLVEAPKTSKTKAEPKKAKPEASSTPATKQIGLELQVEPPAEPILEISPKPDNALSVDQLERWERYRCAVCGESVMGFDGENHIREKHKGVDVGFVKTR